MTGKTAVVTGGNGHVGSHLVENLLDHGYNVIATVRNQEKASRILTLKNAEKLSIRIADVLNPEPWDEILRTADVLFHVATVYSTISKKEIILSTALDGTRNLLESAARMKVPRVVYTSSTAAVGSTPKGKKKSESDWNQNARLPYTQAKTQSEKLAWEIAEKSGLDLRVINPTAVLGGGFDRPTPSVDFIEDAIRGKIPVSLKIPMSFVHVKDVAEAHRKAAEIEEANGRYICAPHVNMTLADLFKKVKQIFPETKAPQKALPNVLLPLAVFQDWIGSKISKRDRRLTRDMVRGFFRGDASYDSSKAQNELEMDWIDFDTCVKDTVEAFL